MSDLTAREGNERTSVLNDTGRLGSGGEGAFDDKPTVRPKGMAGGKGLHVWVESDLFPKARIHLQGAIGQSPHDRGTSEI
jgi:hypothetical protein